MTIQTTPSNELYLMLGRMEGKLDSLIASHNESKADHDKLATRVSSLEKSRSWLMGAAATVGALSGILSTLFLGKH